MKTINKEGAKVRILFQKINRLLRTRITTLCDLKVNAKVLVIESDDWGSIRISSKDNWEKLLLEGYPVDKRPYERFDILESDKDVEELSQVLLRYKDVKGHHPVITLNYLSTNPDFEAIRHNGFSSYEFESIEETYKRYPDSHNVIELVKRGILDGIFCVQSHGREHFNVEDWMKSLRNGDYDSLKAFDMEMCGVPPKDNIKQGNRFMGALKADSEESQRRINLIVEEGLKLFEQIWGYKSRTFIAPRYMWNDSIEKVLYENGVRLIQSDRRQKISDGDSIKIHYTGQRNNYGQKYSVRNCHFEPSTEPESRDVDKVISEIKSLFRKHRVVIISCHRINFVSGIQESNRIENLKRLSEILERIIKEVPDVEFMSSDQLIELL